MEIAVTGIRVLPDRNNGMLVMYYNVSKVHESVKNDQNNNWSA